MSEELEVFYEGPVIRTDAELKKYLIDKYGPADGVKFYLEYKETNDH